MLGRYVYNTMEHVYYLCKFCTTPKKNWIKVHKVVIHKFGFLTSIMLFGSGISQPTSNVGRKKKKD